MLGIILGVLDIALLGTYVGIEIGSSKCSTNGNEDYKIDGLFPVC